MKLLSTKVLLLIALAGTLLFGACSKKSDPTPTNAKTGTISINGINYPTIIIGNQTWTSTNYYGATGATSFNATYGNYYTLALASAVTLPGGWRIPTRADYNNLLSNFTTTKNSAGDYSGGLSVAQALSDTAAFKGLGLVAGNSSGFSAAAGGEYDLNSKTVVNNFIDGVFLTSTTGTVNSATVSYVFAITNDGVNVGLSNLSYNASIDYNSNPFAYSLRFVKDN